MSRTSVKIDFGLGKHITIVIQMKTDRTWPDITRGQYLQWTYDFFASQKVTENKLNDNGKL